MCTILPICNLFFLLYYYYLWYDIRPQSIYTMYMSEWMRQHISLMSAAVILQPWTRNWNYLHTLNGFLPETRNEIYVDEMKKTKNHNNKWNYAIIRPMRKESEIDHEQRPLNVIYKKENRRKKKKKSKMKQTVWLQHIICVYVCGASMNRPMPVMSTTQNDREESNKTQSTKMNT